MLYLIVTAFLSSERLIFIDETGTNLSMTRNYARSEKGTRAISSKPTSKGKLTTLIGAISLKGVIAAMTVEGGTKTEVFITYLRELLLPELKPDDIVVMDNLQAHKSKEVRELIESKGAKLLYLPRYSPDLSPIEFCWSKVKSYLRKKSARNKEFLNQYIKEALDLVTIEDIKSWFNHCSYCAT